MTRPDGGVQLSTSLAHREGVPFPGSGLTKRHWLTLMTKLSSLVALVGVVIGSFYYSSPNSPNWNPNDYAMVEIWAVAAIPMCICFFAWVIVATNWLWKEATVAASPLPSPAQICTQLQSEHGRAPTVEEVAGVRQMLQGRRNEALVNTGIGLAAFYIIHGRIE